ncbi:MAG TPA: DUF1080 domain-containing protein [Planctomycetaceae bacterium]|nr:DUF1080 domain-containing protein [Planctomycetaceae bacterium]
MCFRRAAAIAALIVAAAAGSSRGQDERASDPRRLAILNPAEGGPDFADQGEYAGQVFVRDGNAWRTRPSGLQVAALGDGQFLGVLYAGGLPGAGWDRSERLPLGGSRTASGVELEGDGTYVTIAGGTAKLASGRRLLVGELRKVHRASPTLGLRGPAGARVLFDGTSTGRLRAGRMASDGLLMEGAEFATPRDFSLHVEFLLPYMPQARGQGRANSGVYLQSRYEVQILDSFALEGAENECGALYRQRRPSVNMCLPPLVWQTYDIDFTSPRFDARGAKVRNARLTVRHNGTVIHDNVEVLAKTGAGATEGASVLPTKLQDHGNPVRFRNVWLVDRERIRTVSHAGAGGVAGAVPPTWPSRVHGRAGPAHVPWGTPTSPGVRVGRPSSIGFHGELYGPYSGAFGPQYGIPSYGLGGVP